jgi:GT2 family glycosyltransferase
MVGALLMRREVFEQVGGFDEHLGRREVVEWGARLRRSAVVMAPLDEVVLLRRLHEKNHGNDGAHHPQLLAAVRSHLIALKDADRAPDPG